jgi:integrase
MRLNRLSAVKVQNARKPGLYPDGGGLYLQVTSRVEGSLNRSWLFRFAVHDATKRSGRRERWMGLGSLATVTLADARAAALDARKLCRTSIDPIEARKAAKAATALAQAKTKTFDECRNAYIMANRAGWRNKKHQDQWTNTLETYVTPVFGNLPVAAIDTALVTQVLEPLWATKPETASRLRQRIERVLDWAKVKGFRAGDTSARWTGHLDQVFPAISKVRNVRHHPALPYAQMGAFMLALRERVGITPRALEFTILTGTRTDAVIKTRWSEIDLAEKVWTVPPDRAKRKRQNWKEHRAPLSPAALNVIATLMETREDGQDFVFVGGRPDQPLSNGAMLELVKEMGWTDEKGDRITPHGFRSTFRTWGEECTDFPADLLKACLGQTVGTKVDWAYQRGELFEKRKRVMAAWAEFCGVVPRERVAEKKGRRHQSPRERCAVKGRPTERPPAAGAPPPSGQD